MYMYFAFTCRPLNFVYIPVHIAVNYMLLTIIHLPSTFSLPPSLSLSLSFSLSPSFPPCIFSHYFSILILHPHTPVSTAASPVSYAVTTASYSRLRWPLISGTTEILQSTSQSTRHLTTRTLHQLHTHTHTHTVMTSLITIRPHFCRCAQAL